MPVQWKQVGENVKQRMPVNLTRRLAGDVRAHLTAGDADAAYARLAEHHRRVARTPLLTDFLIGLLDHRGEPERALALARENARRHLDEFRPLLTEPAAAPELAPPQRIFISGFIRSGSSAVMDWLRGYAGVTAWAPKGEVRLVKDPGGMADLVARCEQQRELTDSDLVDFYLHIVGRKVVVPGSETLPKWKAVNHNSRKLFGDETARGYLAELLECFLDLADLRMRRALPLSRLSRRLSTAFTRATDAAAAASGADVVLLDQAINAFRLGLSALVPPSTFLVVHRDPRDQFVDAEPILQRLGQPVKSVDQFAERYRETRLAAERDLAAMLRQGHRPITMSFEDFVLDHADRTEWLAAQLNLSGRPRTDEHYDPARARSSVGKHGTELSADDARVLAERLPEYVDDRVNGAG